MPEYLHPLPQDIAARIRLGVADPYEQLRHARLLEIAQRNSYPWQGVNVSRGSSNTGNGGARASFTVFQSH